MSDKEWPTEPSTQAAAPAQGTWADAASGRFEGRGAFQQAVRDALGEAARVGCRELILCDADYADWPLSDPTVIDALQAWAMSHRRLTVLAAQYEPLARQHVRWVNWRRQWSHIVETRAVEHVPGVEIPSLLLAPGLLAVRRLDLASHRGVVDRRPSDLTPVAEQLQELMDKAVPAFPVTTLGL